MALVQYSDSEDEEEGLPPPPKKSKVADPAPSKLPPLPSAFHDLYSSTVRTSTQDDPSLHGGRKRVTPHVEGNWPTHVYLEWRPVQSESKLLSELVAGSDASSNSNPQRGNGQIQSLLHNELGVSLPLHISLSRPLVLRTEQRVAFLDQLREAVTRSGVRTFTVKPAGLRWHPNETKTRWFLVMTLENDKALPSLLSACNRVAAAFGQPLLYLEDTGNPEAEHAEADQEHEERPAHPNFYAENQFHISLAWSLHSHASRNPDVSSKQAPESNFHAHSSAALGSTTQIRALKIEMDEVKVRVGQDVQAFSLPTRRGSKSSVG